ncbi:hypothetical protein [Streptomyces sp. NPDC052042]|uniref:hypothetical protein n=1 Tax=Streptomyces sp. NPDC052042 TaxID=3365683 RepID=UPI0037CDABB2
MRAARPPRRTAAVLAGLSCLLLPLLGQVPKASIATEADGPAGAVTCGTAGTAPAGPGARREDACGRVLRIPFTDIAVVHQG